MAGTVVVDAVKSSTTGAPAFQNTNGTEIGTLCRAWVNFNGNAASIRASFNVSSVTRNTTGQYTVNFTNAMSDVNYAICGVANQAGNTTGGTDRNLGGYQTSTSSCAVACTAYIGGTTYADATYMNVAIFR